MRRADRLFQIVQILRRRRVTTAAQLAGELGISERSVYRDIRDLVGSGVPIEGEAGVGYALRGYDLPPLMFSGDEIEALVLGARIVESWGGPELAKAARNALVKIETALPRRLQAKVARARLYAPSFHVGPRHTAALGDLRAAIAERRLVKLGYVREDGAASRRTVRPLGLYFWGSTWSLAAYCELRADFRNFRLDRIDGLEVLAARFEEEDGLRLEDFVRRMNDEG